MSFTPPLGGSGGFLPPNTGFRQVSEEGAVGGAFRPVGQFSPPPARRSRALPFVIIGLFFWPMLFVAASYHAEDQRAFDAAMLEYRSGIDPDWYWQGRTGRFQKEPRKQLNIFAKTAIVIIVLVIAIFLVGLAGG